MLEPNLNLVLGAVNMAISDQLVLCLNNRVFNQYIYPPPFSYKNYTGLYATHSKQNKRKRNTLCKCHMQSFKENHILLHLKKTPHTCTHYMHFFFPQTSTPKQIYLFIRLFFLFKKK